MKEIYGTLNMPVSMKCESMEDAQILVNDYNVDIYELEVNWQRLKVHDVNIEWETEFDDDEE